MFGDGMVMTAHEAEQAHIKQMELDQNTKQSVIEMLDNGCNLVVCRVNNRRKYEVKDSVVIVTSRIGRDGHLDINNYAWESAVALNLDGTEMTVYDYKKATSHLY